MAIGVIAVGDARCPVDDELRRRPVRGAGGREGVSRGQMKPLEKTAKEFGAKGLAWWKPGEEGGAAGPMARWCEGAPGFFSKGR